MGKKCHQSSSSSSSSYISTNSTSSCFNFKSNSDCCKKYPKCKCAVNKCIPMYIPNNYVGCAPCPPYPSCPSPCLPPCPVIKSQSYNNLNSIVTTSTTLTAQFNLYICDTTLNNLTLTLPQISTLASCYYNKMFIISNKDTTSTNSITLATTGGDTIIGSTTIGINESICLYSTFIGGVGYWSVV